MQKTEHYGDAEFLDEQPRLLDLIPRGPFALAAVLVTVIAVFAGLQAAYAWMVGRAADGGPTFAALDLAAKGSLGGWLASLVLLAAAAAALLVYSIRRHRIDDYRGRYRVWLWAAAYWCLLAGDQAVGFREGFRYGMVALTGTTLIGDGNLWWAALDILLFGAIGSRLVLDMRPCRFSTFALIVGAAAHVAALAGWMGWIYPEVGAREIMLQAGAEMLAAIMLFAAMTWHARYVRLDAEGLLPCRETPADRRPAEVKPSSQSAPRSGWTNRWVKSDPPSGVHPAFQRASPTATMVSSTSAASSTSASPAIPVQRKLTKQERQVLKEKLLRERQQRERRGL